MIEHERHAEQRNVAAERALERKSEMPTLRRGRLEERVRAGRAQRIRSCRREERRRPAVQHRLGGAHDDHEIGLDECSVDAQRRARRVVEPDELRILDVVHDHLAVKATRELGSDEGLERTLRRSAGETRCDEKRLIPRRDAVPLELRDDGGDRQLARIVRRARNRQRRRLDDDRRASAAPRERLEPIARKREAQRVAHRGADVGNGSPGRRRP